MIPTPKPDRVKANPSMTHAAMRRKARAGKIAGKKHAQDRFFNGTTTAQSVNTTVVPAAQVVARALGQSAQLKTKRTGHDPSVVQDTPTKSNTPLKRG